MLSQLCGNTLNKQVKPEAGDGLVSLSVFNMRPTGSAESFPCPRREAEEEQGWLPLILFTGSLL